MAPSFSGGFDCAIAVPAATIIADASSPETSLFTKTLPGSLRLRIVGYLLRQSCRKPPAAASRRGAEVACGDFR
jgi:hypothetical protein